MKTMHDLFHQERETWLENARATAHKLLKRRRTITIEDVLEKCPRPNYIHPNTTGSVFHNIDFKAVGWRKSARPMIHSRWVQVWMLNRGK